MTRCAPGGPSGQERVWHTRDAILLCIGHGSGNEKLVRTAARLAAKFGSVWHAVYVETPQLHGLPENQRRAILSALRLAQELGAETATLSDPQEDKAILRYAREHNTGKIVIGRRQHRRWFSRESFADRLARRAPDLDLVIVALDDKPASLPNRTPDARTFGDKWRIQIRAASVAVVLLRPDYGDCQPVAHRLRRRQSGHDLSARRRCGRALYGRWPSVLATVINVISFDLFYRSARDACCLGRAVHSDFCRDAYRRAGDRESDGRRTLPARIARYREQRTRHLYEMSKSLAVGRTQRDIVQTSEQFIRSTFHASNLILLPDEQGRLRPLTSPTGMTPWDEAIARWSFDKGLPAGAGTDTLPGVPYQILPLRSADKNHGLVIVEPSNLRQLMIPEQQRLLETFTLLVASALERLALTASEEQARLASERESIRNSLLAALSHDLRTPLTVLFGQSEILTLDLAAEGSKHAMQASEIRQHVLNTTRTVNNLLDMARIQSGGFNLKKSGSPLRRLSAVR